MLHFTTISPILRLAAPAMPRFLGDSGTPKRIDHQNSPTGGSFHYGNYLFTVIKSNLASASRMVHEEQTLATVIIMFGGILCLLPLNCHALKSCVLMFACIF
jgi:hypothetical protein